MATDKVEMRNWESLRRSKQYEVRMRGFFGGKLFLTLRTKPSYSNWLPEH
ncbi:predicted protein [Botrytis cinerea T4]|uniref:Uncharacterized protein n=1 Tax=Botryotinia fuckeliana (strain T4) TaxID=999810 RepID=G2Y6X2_BOTF4|nr:predicted protein [Botrytis cinerea T4]